jgi:hypothetical protein
MQVFALSLLLLLHAAQPSGPVAFDTDNGLHVQVESNGHFEVRTSTPPWTFGGEIGRPVTRLRVADGRDGIGPYQEISFESVSAQAPGGSIRAYRVNPIVLFTTDYRVTTTTSDDFPRLRTYPNLPFKLSYRTLPFAPYQFNSVADAADSPWIFFDQQATAFLLAPATNVPVARSTLNADGSLSSNIAPVGAIPAGFAHATMLVTGVGINQLFETWGQAMTRGYQKTRPSNDADLTLDKLGYWTDNGATYYYNFDPALGYQGSLLAIEREFQAKGLRLGYMQLDSWWYPKGAEARWDDRLGGIFRYRAAAELFPDGLAAFQNLLGLPLVTHARWIDPASPLRAEFASSGKVITDERYWDEVMAYLHQSGVVTYEQDWLGSEAQPVYDLVAPEQFMGNMANAAARNAMTLQYCLPLPRHVLQTLSYANVTTMRVSYDRFDSSHWDEFLYDSRLASALGIWPFTDVFMSTERTNLLIATLSAGIVGVGDPLGGVDVDNLRMVIRADGTIVKPDVPIVPIDETYLAQARVGAHQPMVASTYSEHGDLRALYVLAYARGGASQLASFSPASLGIPGATYVYDVFDGQGTLVPAGQRFDADVSADGAYYVVAPVGPSGVAFLGDRGLFAALGQKRIEALDDDGSVHAAVVFADGETQVTLHGYAPAPPTVTSADARVDDVEYDPQTQRFSIVLRPSAAPGTAHVTVRLDAVETGGEA